MARSRFFSQGVRADDELAELGLQRAQAAAYDTPRAMTAATVVLDLTKKQHRNSIHPASEAQKAAGNYAEQIGELKYAFNFVANVTSRAFLFPAIIGDEGQVPMEAKSYLNKIREEGRENPEKLEEAVALAQELMRELRARDQFIRRMVLNFSIPGECYLANLPRWNIYSIDEIKPGQPPRFQRKRNSSSIINLPKDTYIARMWREHWRYSFEADSTMLGVLDFCLAEGTMVATPTGSRPIEEIEVGQEVWSWDEDMGMVSAPVARVLPRGTKGTMVVRCANRTITSTAEHEYLVLRRVTDGRQGHRWATKYFTEWVETQNLTRGDLLITADGTPNDGVPTSLPDGTEVTEDVAWLLGLLTGDGTVNAGTIGVCVAPNHPEHEERVRRVVKDTWGLTCYRKNGHAVRWTRKSLADTLRTVGVVGTFSSDRQIPAIIWAATEKIQRAYLQGYTDADGHITKEGYRSYAATSGRLIRDVRAMYQALGAPVSNIFVEKREPLYIAGNKITSNPKSLHRFHVYERRGTPGMSLVTGATGRDLLGEGYTVSRVLEVSEGPTVPVYDLDVPGTRCFLADGVVVHNCEKLVLYDQLVRSTIRSGLGAGIITLPQGTEALGGMTLEDAVRKVTIDPVENEAALGTVDPLILLLPNNPNLKDAIGRIELARQLDPALAEEASKALDRLMSSIDIPKDLVSGFSDVRYANGVAIDDSLYKAHCEPLLMLCSDSLTAAYLQVRMRKHRIDPDIIDRFCVWYNPSEIVTRPDESAAADSGFGNDLLSGKAWRRARGFTEDDAPEPKEILQKAALGGRVPPDMAAVIIESIDPKFFADQRKKGQEAAALPDEVRNLLSGEGGAGGTEPAPTTPEQIPQPDTSAGQTPAEQVNTNGSPVVPNGSRPPALRQDRERT